MLPFNHSYFYSVPYEVIWSRKEQNTLVTSFQASLISTKSSPPPPFNGAGQKEAKNYLAHPVTPSSFLFFYPLMSVPISRIISALGNKDA